MFFFSTENLKFERLEKISVAQQWVRGIQRSEISVAVLQCCRKKKVEA